MKPIRIALLVSVGGVLLFLGDAAPESSRRLQLLPSLQLVPEAHAIFGVWRRHARRWAVVGTAAMASTAVAASAAAGASAAAAADAQAAAAQQQAAAASTTPPPPPALGKELPLGTVVSKLPGGCTSTPAGGIEYYYCDGNFYRAMFQGNSLVYVTARPK
ncbi:MAG: hypothetical protein P8Y76_04150 [bacterium]|jgi:hypothetical protein